MVASAIASRALLGMEAPRVTVETHLPGGLPGFTLVGLPETVVREARDRVKSAIQNCGFAFPRGRVVVNLAPADLAKEGARYDLPIAVSILCATGQLDYARARTFEFVGELSLYGDVRPVRGVLSALQARSLDSADPTRVASLVIPGENSEDILAPLPKPPLLLSHLTQLPELLQAPQDFRWETSKIKTPGVSTAVVGAQPAAISLDQVVGQQAAKRTLIIAAAGGHHLLMVGPPGSGKTLLARCFSSLLPPLSAAEAMEVAAIHSVAGQSTQSKVAHSTRPFREPHHSVTAPALAGGGTRSGITPGEISLAHRGVLFLDELPHFKPSVLDLLREPLSNGYISISRAHHAARFPAQFQLLCAMNPCPAGLTCDAQDCRCTPTKVRAYQSRVSGPLLDRIELQINVAAVSPTDLLARPQREPSAATSEHHRAQQQIRQAQRLALERQDCLNAHCPPTSLDSDSAAASLESRQLLEQALEQLKLSARGYHGVLRVARTIADLDEALAANDPVQVQHLQEALGYRKVDWQLP